VSSSWLVETDLDRCIGSGACAFTAPDVFDVDDAGQVRIIGRTVTGDERIRTAVDNCPTDALRLTEGGE
jgi:ferredoxin